MAPYPTVSQMTGRCPICGTVPTNPCALLPCDVIDCPRPHDWSSYGPAPPVDTQAAESVEAAIETARVARFDPEG